MRQVPFLQNLLFQVTYPGILWPWHKVHVLENGLLKKVFGHENNAVNLCVLWKSNNIFRIVKAKNYHEQGM
jgi:hypothetical protein